MKKEFKEIVKVLSELHKDYPSFGIGRHINTALADYEESFYLPDKELLFALKKYQMTLLSENEMEISPEYINNIINDGCNLDNILNEDDGYEE